MIHVRYFRHKTLSLHFISYEITNNYHVTMWRMTAPSFVSGRYCYIFLFFIFMGSFPPIKTTVYMYISDNCETCLSKKADRDCRINTGYSCLTVITTESSELGPVDSQLVFSTQELCLIKIEENPCMDNSSKFGYETRTKRSPNRANPFD